jgi:phosphatidylserine decarboxylase
MPQIAHQYFDRTSGQLETEHLYQDRLVMFFYSRVRESMPVLFRLLTSRTSTRLLGYLNYDTHWGSGACRKFMRENGIDLDECLDDPEAFVSARQVFERRICYWTTRPMPSDPRIVVSPADARVLVGSFRGGAPLFIKEKFFEYQELFGGGRGAWLKEFADGDFAIFRLTPEKYHYNHVPVSGVVLDHYELHGDYHSCNPGATIQVATPYSKNRRVVTIIDTDVTGGSGVGKVAMIEIVALMIGDIVQCYSAHRYHAPVPITPGLSLERGGPKSLFRPGSSTTVLVFQPDCIRFAADLLANQKRADACSRYATGFGLPLVETDVRVRSLIAYPEEGASLC